MLYACTAARIGDWDVALTAADEARRLAEEFADPQAAAAADTASSLVAAMRGDEQKAELLAARAEMVAEPVGANITMAFAQFGKVLAALASGRHADAYASADRLFDPADSAYHPVISSWLIADLAEAARHVDRVDAARARVAQVEASVGEPPGHLDRPGSEPCPSAGGGSGGSRRSLRGGAGARPDTVAVPARQGPARLRPVAAAAAPCRRFTRRPAGRARHLRCAGVRAVGRAGAARVARIRANAAGAACPRHAIN